MGNSLGVIIPQEILRAARLQRGDDVEVRFHDDGAARGVFISGIKIIS